MTRANATITLVMPCLNEAETLECCIIKARQGFEKAGLVGEIVVADNGSTDGSREIAKHCGVTLVAVAEKGYGNALRGGITAASSPWILIGDADDSYDFSEIGAFVQKFQEGYDLVSGCRLPSGGGKILPGAMPWKNRWIGNPALSWLGRIFFKTPINDFHCGMRAFTKKAYELMNLQTTGMEFASEMIMKASLGKLKVAQVPITLSPDGRSRKPHLRPWRDGWRHLRFMLISSPQWLFLIPGGVISLLGFFMMFLLLLGPITLGQVILDSGTMMVAAMMMLLGMQLSSFAFSARIFAARMQLIPEDLKFNKLVDLFTLEKGLLLGALFVLAGGLLGVFAFYQWREVHFSHLSYSENMRLLIPGVTFTVLGIQLIFTSFFWSLLELKTSQHAPY
ncbi:MAG: glycosyltransferase family 2 protein [Chthoniobacterales bacterium]|nr:glycosyltransferase family 2 protein [Chthoniobacterales bacterium]